MASKVRNPDKIMWKCGNLKMWECGNEFENEGI